MRSISTKWMKENKTMMTIEKLNAQYEDREEDERYLDLQAVLGSEEDIESAYDEYGDFKCIGWFSCDCCPARSQCTEL